MSKRGIAKLVTFIVLLEWTIFTLTNIKAFQALPDFYEVTLHTWTFVAWLALFAVCVNDTEL